MKIGRIVELSHVLHPREEEYKLELQTHFVDDLLPGYTRKKGLWYIMQEVRLCTHVGTHLEAPLHCLEDGQDVSEIPLNRLIGEAVVLDFTYKKPNEPITLEEMKEVGAEIRENDIVLIKTGLSKFYNTEHAHERPYPTLEAVKWLVEKKIACLGLDCSGVEVRGADDQPNHRTLFENGTPLIEHLTNLDQLRRQRVWLFILPWRVKGLEAAPVRVIAIEDAEN
ncbi:MAG: cyclase family protein [Chloroflexota bacterium]